ncbi:MAG: Smr/MutS family protein [Pikeienuella sp.]
MKRRKGRTLTAEESSLWQKVAKTISPVAPAYQNMASDRDAGAKTTPPAPNVLASTPPAPISVAVPPLPRPQQWMKPYSKGEPLIRIPQPAPTPPSGLDRRTEERLRKGLRAPDARLDLHGMTADRAHVALNKFISASRSAGHRCVLVITGKGAPGADGRGGVLRREAPFWLSTPPLSSMIVHTAPAHPRHGGGGALYVYLKRQR